MVHACAGGATNKKHQTLGEAMDEAKRLATANPGRRFGVMELVSCYEGETARANGRKSRAHATGHGTVRITAPIT